MDLDDERPWYVMPWYEMGSLDDRIELRREGLAANRLEALRIVQALASAVEDIHLMGVAHRDIKPGNVLLDGNKVLLADFGLCLEVDDPEERATTTYEAVGSRLYIAPENEAGINAEADQRPADFYAFGKTAWAIFADQPPPPRERIRESDYSLAKTTGDSRLRVIDELLYDLLNLDPRVRLQDWAVVRGELASVEGQIAGRSRSPAPQILPSDILAKARRLAAAPAVLAANEDRERAQGLRLWLTSLVQRMHENARHVELDVSDLIVAAGGVLTVVATTGGAASAEIIEVFSSSGYGEVPIGTWSVGGPPGSDGVVLLIHSQQGVATFPAISIRISPALIENEVWFLAVPTIAFAGEREKACTALAPLFFACSGPYPVRRQATIDRAIELIDQLSSQFISLVGQYIVAMVNGKDVESPDTWAEFE